MNHRKLLYVFWSSTFLYAAGSPARGQPDEPLTQIFLTEAPKQWAQYEGFAHQLQGIINRRAFLTNHQRGWKEKENRARCSIKQNERCALVSGQPIKKNIDDLDEYCFLSNPNYAAELRSRSKSPVYLLHRCESNPAFAFIGNTAPEWAFKELSPHFCYGGTKLSVRLGKPGFQVMNVARQKLGAENLIRVDFTDIHETKNDKIETNGSMLFDPLRHWCLREVKQRTTQDGRAGHIVTDAVLTYQTELQGEYPIMKRATMLYDSSFPSRHEIDYEIKIDGKVSDEEFTLSAFGLPEPMGTIKHPARSRWHWWMAQAGIICLGLAAWVSWLARRRRQNTSTDTAVTPGG